MSATPSLLSKPKNIHYQLNPERPSKVRLADTTNDLNDQAGLIPALKFLERFPRLDQTGCSAFTRQKWELSTGLCELLISAGGIGGAKAMTKVRAAWSIGVSTKMRERVSIADGNRYRPLV